MSFYPFGVPVVPFAPVVEPVVSPCCAPVVEPVVSTCCAPAPCFTCPVLPNYPVIEPVVPCAPCAYPFAGIPYSLPYYGWGC